MVILNHPSYGPPLYSVVMLKALPLLPLSLAVLPLVSARIHHSLVPEDPFAFPKYRVTFLHGLPVLNETAQRWFQHGLKGGELEFMDQPWQEQHFRVPPIQSIDGGDSQFPVASHVGALYSNVPNALNAHALFHVSLTLLPSRRTVLST